MNAVIEVNRLRKVYGDNVAVDDVSFEVAQGEIFGLLGPNGAGKTTTVECLQGLRRPDGGQARVLGFDPAVDSSKLRRRIGCQLQESALPDRIRVWEALDLFASLNPEGLDWRVLMEQWGLTAKRNAAFGSLSGGQRQRLFVALALVNDPEVVFLDEMTTGLDPAARRVAWELIEAIRGRGKTVVMVTHFMEEAERLCDRVAIMDRGRVISLDSPAKLIEAHSGSVSVCFRVSGEDLSWLQDLSCVERVIVRGAQVEVRGSEPVGALVVAALMERGIVPRDLMVTRVTLEEVFLAVTGGDERGPDTNADCGASDVD